MFLTLHQIEPMQSCLVTPLTSASSSFVNGDGLPILIGSGIACITSKASTQWLVNFFVHKFYHLVFDMFLVSNVINFFSLYFLIFVTVNPHFASHFGWWWIALLDSFVFLPLWISPILWFPLVTCQTTLLKKANRINLFIHIIHKALLSILITHWDNKHKIGNAWMPAWG